MKTLRTVAEVRAALARPRAEGIVGLVPTMGALHEGHVSLVRAARAECDTVVVTLFVNPTQFGDPADLQAYPRDEAADARVAAEAGADFLFAPAADEIYGREHATWVDVQGAAEGLEGAYRPGHFRGVATVCLKLFLITAPHRAYFGQKDAQQVAVIKQMVQDLNVDLDIRVMPIVRAADGLALSSRNARLSSEERTRALAIPRALEAGVAAHRAGRDPVAAARTLLTDADVDVDYVAVADFHGLPTLAIAAKVGRTRLIDNAVLDNPSADLAQKEPPHGR
jgi:pantoate--beta-alanine ligase